MDKLLSRLQKCGCVVCVCENEDQCKGCGAKSCGTHPVGKIPEPVYQAQAKRPYAQPNAQRRSIYTDADTWAKLKALGKGNASAGIREAVRLSENLTHDLRELAQCGHNKLDGDNQQ